MSSALRRVVVHNHVPARKRARARDAATATYEVWYIDRDGRRKMASVTAESQLAAWAAVRRATGAKQLISAEMARGGARDAESGRPFGGVVQEGGKWYFYDPDSGEQRGPFDWKSQAHEAWSKSLRRREARQIGRQTYPGRDASEWVMVSSQVWEKLVVGKVYRIRGRRGRVLAKVPADRGTAGMPAAKVEWVEESRDADPSDRPGVFYVTYISHTGDQVKRVRVTAESEAEAVKAGRSALGFGGSSWKVLKVERP